MQYDSQNARFSACGRYRYSLERSWNSGRGRVLFIGLNPSTADQRQDDPTIRRCARFARDWGYREMEVVNLFAFRATDPGDLKSATDPVGEENDAWIDRAHARSDRTIACWGSRGSFLDRGRAVGRRLRNLFCLKLNRGHHPGHPLYLRARLRPFPYDPGKPADGAGGLNP